MIAALRTGIAFGLSTCMMFVIYLVGFGYGGYLVENEGLRGDQMFRAVMAIMFGASGAGQAASFGPDMMVA